MKEHDIRYFSFSKEPYEIEEIIHNSNMNMEWKWEDSICPHCKHRIERRMIHTFYEIEILTQPANRNNIVVIGHTTDGRIMHIPKEEKIYKEILKKSNKFKELAEVN
jgi:hypothetical protein